MPIQLKCAVCGKPFSVKPCRVKTAKYHNRVCQARAVFGTEKAKAKFERYYINKRLNS